MQTPKNKNAKSIQKWVLLLLLSGAMPMARADDTPAQDMSPPAAQQTNLLPSTFHPAGVLDCPQAAQPWCAQPRLLEPVLVPLKEAEQSPAPDPALTTPLNSLQIAQPDPQGLQPGQTQPYLPEPAIPDHGTVSWQNLWLNRQVQAAGTDLKQDVPKAVWKPFGDEINPTNSDYIIQEEEGRKTDKQEVFDPTSIDGEGMNAIDTTVPTQTQN